MLAVGALIVFQINMLTLLPLHLHANIHCDLAINKHTDELKSVKLLGEVLMEKLTWLLAPTFATRSADETRGVLQESLTNVCVLISLFNRLHYRWNLSLIINKEQIISLRTSSTVRVMIRLTRDPLHFYRASILIFWSPPPLPPQWRASIFWPHRQQWCSSWISPLIFSLIFAWGLPPWLLSFLLILPL